MKTTIDFLDDLKAKHGLKSDYAIAKFLGCSCSRISNYRSKRTHLGDEEAIIMAEKLEISPAYVLACVHFERAKNAPEKAAWRDIMERFGGIAAALFIGVAANLMLGGQGHDGLPLLLGFISEQCILC